MDTQNQLKGCLGSNCKTHENRALNKAAFVQWSAESVQLQGYRPYIIALHGLQQQRTKGLSTAVLTLHRAMLECNRQTMNDCCEQLNGAIY
jgi:hypothetical protein